MPRCCCFLVGARASGKTTVAQAAARLLAWQAVDVDQLIESRWGRTIPEIFATDGQQSFRDSEELVMQDLIQTGDRSVFGTGGGCLERPATGERLRQSGQPVIYLQAPAEVLQERLRAHLGERPSLTGGDPIEELPAVLARREAAYLAVASAILDARQAVESLAAAVAEIVENRLKAG